MKHECLSCGYICEPWAGTPIAKSHGGSVFTALPDGRVCPECGTSPGQFEPLPE